MGRFSKLETGSSSPHDDDIAKPSPRAGQDADADESPSYDVAHYQAEGDKLFFVGEYQKALRMYSRGIQSDHSAIMPWVGQVVCLVELKQTKEAMVWVRRALELFPDDARLISLQGVVYANQGMAQRGLGCSDMALTMSGADPLVWVMRGEILALADNKNSDFCFDKAVENCPHDDWKTRMRIGILLIRQKKWAKAAKYLREAAALDSTNDYMWERLGYATEHLGLTQPAIEAYNTAITINPGNTTAGAAIRRLTNTPFFVRWFRRLR